MPRPKSGYKLSDGTKVPGTTTITGRFKDAGALIGWAYKCGCDGVDMYHSRETSMDAGTCCHEMIDHHLHGRPEPLDLEKYSKEVKAAAEHAYLGYLEWAEQNKVQVRKSELSLVSERHRFGGSIDCAAIQGKLRLLDFKTGGIYPEHLIQVAGAYTLLWQEHFGKEEIHGIDLLAISKPEFLTDPVGFKHYHWSGEIIPICQAAFLHMRDLYDLDKRIKSLL